MKKPKISIEQEKIELIQKQIYSLITDSINQSQRIDHLYKILADSLREKKENNLNVTLQ